MTDEPEPFVMSMGPDPEDDDAPERTGDATANEDDDAAAPLPESIADLIGEASRTATEQAVQAATGTAPEDRSSDVWGAPDDDEDLDAVWSAAADRHRGSHVFDDVLGTEDSWQSTTRMPPPAADPTVGLDDDPVHDPRDEPEVFKLSIDDDAADAPAAVDDLAAAMVTPRESSGPDAPDEGPDTDEAGAGGADPEPFRFAAGPATTAPAALPDHVPAAGRDEPDLFAFAFDERDAEDGTPDEPDADVRSEDVDDRMLVEEPIHDDAADEPAPLEDPVSEVPDDADDQDVWADAEPSDGDASDPWAAASEGADEPVWEQATEDAPWTAPSSPDTRPPAPLGEAAQDDPDDPDDRAWTFDIGADREASFDDVDEVDDQHANPTADDDHEPTLAESARPRADTGWADLSEEQSTWTLDPVPDGATFPVDDATAPDPDGFAAVLDDADQFAAALGEAEHAGETAPDDDEDDGFLPDDEPLPPTRAPDPPFETDSAALGDVIEDLLSDIPATSPAADGPDEDPLDALDDALAGLDQFDDLQDSAPAATETAPTEQPAAPEAPPVPEAPPAPESSPDDEWDDLAAMPPPASATTSMPPPTAAPPPVAGDAPAAADAPDDAPAEARAPAEPDPEDEEGPAADEPAPPAVPPGMSFSSKPKKRGLFGG